MNKIWVIGIGVILIIGGIFIAFWLVGSKTQAPATNPPSGQTTSLPVAGNAPQSSTTLSVGSGILISTSDGHALETNDFITHDSATVKDPSNSGYYYLGYHESEGVSDPTASANPPYIITYISSSQYFMIALLQEPIGEVRQSAEQYLLGHLGISESQMCKLNYIVSVPDKVNSTYSGENLGFSFCPNSVTLPQ